MMHTNEGEKFLDASYLGQEIEAELDAEEGDQMPLLEGEDLEVIEEAEVPPMAKTDVTFANVHPDNKQELELLAGKMFLRTLDNPQFMGEITAKESKSGGVSFAPSENPIEHPLFRLVAGRELMEQMRDIALSLRGEGGDRTLKTRGQAEMKAVKVILEQLRGALEAYSKIRPSEAQVLLGKKEKLRNERTILQQIVDHVMEVNLTREEVAQLEAQIRAAQRSAVREGGAAFAPIAIPLAREKFIAGFVDKWLSSNEKSSDKAYVTGVFDALRAHTMSAQNADIGLQAEAIRLLKEDVKQKQERVQMGRTGTDR